MSMNVYLKEDIRALNGFTSKRYQDDSGDDMRFKGTRVSRDSDRLYLILSDNDAIPSELNDLVEEISYYTTIPQMATRESGIYKLDSAECELMLKDSGNPKYGIPSYQLKIRAKTLQDIHTLLHQIKTGTIRPAESYEARQTGKTQKQLKDELTDTQQHLDEAKATIEELRGDLSIAEARVMAMYRLSADLGESLWPWSQKKTIATQINLALNDGPKE